MSMRLYFILVGLLLVDSYCRTNAESGAGYTLRERIELVETGLEDLDTVEKQVENLETSLEDFEKKVENQLEEGGKRFQTVSYNGKLKLKDQDHIRLQFLGAKNAWLGCPGPVCDLRTCSSRGSNYRYFDGRCSGEEFQIIGEGIRKRPIKSGQRIQLRYSHGINEWMGCPHDNHCDKRDCPGTISQARIFRCTGEIFRIYARGRANGETIYNGDLVMLYFIRGGRYVSIQGQDEEDDTSLNFCPGEAPPAYFSYGICSKNTFRVYQKP